MPQPMRIIGEKSRSFLAAVGEIAIYYQASLAALLRGELDRTRTLWELNNLGVNSLPIVVIINTFAGMVISLHLSSSFAAFGLTAQMGHILTIAFARELAPVLTGIVVAGRAGSAIAAEIGAMAVSEQIDALKTLGIDHRAYLIAPKILAVFLMLPLLIIMANLTGLAGGMGLAVYFKHLTVRTFLDSVLTYIRPWDFLGGITKGFFFGLAITGIGVYYGLHTKYGATGVGTAATKTVVAGVIALFIINFLLTVLFY
ncbi:MAG TPA: ABC transporter permease [Capillibacterium sp.]